MKVADIKERASKGWLTKGLVCIGLGFLWRATQITWPGIPVTLIGLAIFAAMVIYFIKISQQSPQLRGTTRWVVLVLIGGCLNFTAILANHGYMPVIPQAAIANIFQGGLSTFYWYTYIGDWIGGRMSPGDVLMIVGFLAVGLTIIRNQWQQNLTEVTHGRETATE